MRLIAQRYKERLYLRMYDMNAYERERKQKITLAFRTLLGDKCAVCGATEQLECDHINGGGKKERREVFGNDRMKMFRYYLQHPDEAKEKLQLLCKEHNHEKLMDNKEWLRR